MCGRARNVGSRVLLLAGRKMNLNTTATGVKCNMRSCMNCYCCCCRPIQKVPFPILFTCLFAKAFLNFEKEFFHSVSFCCTQNFGTALGHSPAVSRMTLGTRSLSPSSLHYSSHSRFLSQLPVRFLNPTEVCVCACVCQSVINGVASES